MEDANHHHHPHGMYESGGPEAGGYHHPQNPYQPQPHQHAEPVVEVDHNEAMVDMGYEDHAPTVQLQRRRGSMSHDEEKQRRASIKAIMADSTISPMAKRRSIQHLMDGRRNSMEGGGGGTGRRNSIDGGGGAGRRNSITSSVHSGYNSSAGSTCNETPDLGYEQVDMGYGYVHQLDDALEGGDEDNDDEEEDDNVPRSHVTRGFALCNEQTRRSELSRPPCAHYDRKCTIVAACCGAAFGCRICHDDCPALPPKINNGGRRYHRSASLPGSFTSMARQDDDIDTHHQIDRFAIREVICRDCYTRQSSKTYVSIVHGKEGGWPLSPSNRSLWRDRSHIRSSPANSPLQQPLRQLWCSIWSVSLQCVQFVDVR